MTISGVVPLTLDDLHHHTSVSCDDNHILSITSVTVLIEAAAGLSTDIAKATDKDMTCRYTRVKNSHTLLTEAPSFQLVFRSLGLFVIPPPHLLKIESFLTQYDSKFTLNVQRLEFKLTETQAMTGPV